MTPNINLVPALVEVAVSKHPEVLDDPFPPDCELRGFGESGINFAVEFWVMGLMTAKTNTRLMFFLSSGTR